MVQKVAKFEKISLEQWRNDCPLSDDDVYNDILIPSRSTTESAGYDFYSPYSVVLKSGEDYKFPTGIKCRIDNGWVLCAFPRSSLGFKYYTRLANTIGVIDSDYYNNVNNEGHIWVKIRNESDKEVVINKGDKIVQGIFLPYGITEDDNVDKTREGGLGSTGK